jgi:hypothetical protein
MSISNGYLITYWEGTQWVSQDEVVGKEDAEEHIQVAMEVGQCDLITMHCLDRGDVLYTYELFCTNGEWTESYHNGIMNTHSLKKL